MLRNVAVAKKKKQSYNFKPCHYIKRFTSFSFTVIATKKERSLIDIYRSTLIW